MNSFALGLAAFLIGVIAGLRTFTAPAAVSWAAFAGVIPLGGTSLAFLGARFTPFILTALAIFEYFIDQRPETKSRKTAPQFIARIVSGAVCGAALTAPGGSLAPGLFAGAGGAIVGTLGGYAMRRRLASDFRRDRPAGLLEDAIAVVGAVLVVVLS
jgi:uncharacterized membrane protein